MDDHARLVKEMNFSDWLAWFAFDVMGEVSFSRQFGFLEEGRDIDNTLQGIENMIWSGIVIAELPELYDFSQSRWFRMIPVVGQYGSSLNFLIDVSASQALCIDNVENPDCDPQKALAFITERRDGKSVDRRDLLSRFLQLEKDNPAKFDTLDTQILATLNIFAGSDTTSIALRAVLYFLIKDQRVWTKLQKELDTAVADGTMSEATTYNEAQKVPFLQACIKEAMRLHPSLGTQHTRLVPEGGVTIDGRYLPPNVRTMPRT